MPAIRNVASLNRGIEDFIDVKSDHNCTPCRTPFSRASADPKTPKKKKTSNAFFLYRSHVLANNLLPVDIKHQNDASRIAAHMWRAESHETRIHFFALAERERNKQREEEQYILMPSTPALSPSSTSSARSACLSPPLTPDSPYLRTPPAPKIRTRELPSSPSILGSSPWDFDPVFQPKEMPEPNCDEPLIYALSDEWSSPAHASSLSFARDVGFIDRPRKSAPLGISQMAFHTVKTTALPHNQ